MMQSLFSNRPSHIYLSLCSLLMFLLSACGAQLVSDNAITFTLQADGETKEYTYDEPIIVRELLDDLNLVLGENDRINPQLSDLITDGLHVTLVRISYANICEQDEIPFEEVILHNAGLPEGETRLAQSGETGIEETCYSVEYRDDIAGERTPLGEAKMIREPVDQVTYVGTSQNLTPANITGTVAYIDDGDAWIIRGDTSSKRALTRNANLDGLVFQLSPDGSWLLYTAESRDDSFLNQLWVVNTQGVATPKELAPTNVLDADWIPNARNQLTYSTADISESGSPWTALNNLWQIEIEPITGNTLDVQQLLPESSGGQFGWWGTVFDWSPNGEALAWTQADRIGLVDLENQRLNTIATFPPFDGGEIWSWRAPVSWEPESRLLATILHGDPVSNEPPERSSRFDIAILGSNSDFAAEFLAFAGMWSNPQFSPPSQAGSGAQTGMISYLVARDPASSMNGEYDLFVADTDGSNERRLFPPENLPGITVRDSGLTNANMTWNPAGTRIAIIYLGDLWIIDIQSGQARQITFEGKASNPVWGANA